MDESMVELKVELKGETLAGLTVALSVAMMGSKTAGKSVVLKAVPTAWKMAAMMGDYLVGSKVAALAVQ